MENKINVAELLKDCPKGMELYSPIFGQCKLNRIYDRNNKTCIEIIADNNEKIYCDKYGYYFYSLIGEIILFPSKENRDWSKFVPPCQFKDGDVIVTKTSNNYVFYSIYKMIEDKNVLTYIDYTPDDDRIIGTGYILCLIDEIIEQRLATEEEKKKLFDAIKAKGYKWNAETKILEKLVKPKFKVGDIVKDKSDYKAKIVEVCEDDECYAYESLIMHGIGSISFNDQDSFELVPNKFDINTLKPFDKVLVRNTNKSRWCGQFYMSYDENKEYLFECTYYCWRQCIPYEGNEHLLGTTDDCDEYYKNW